jgi:uncharacterized membrane protein
MPDARWSDDRVEQMIGNMLRAGVIVAAVVAAIGGIALLAQHGAKSADYSHFAGETAEFTSIGGIIRGVLALDSRAVVQLGLVLLIATPVMRVVLSLVAFLVQRDRLYVVITSIVLAVLVFSLVFGGG